MQGFAGAVAQAAALSPDLPSYPDVVPGRVLHIDGDYLAYYGSGNDECTKDQAKRNCLSLITNGMLQSGSSAALMHLTTGDSTKGERFLVATVRPYQGQRDSGRKPVNWQFLRDWLETYEGPAFTPKLWRTREADDGMAAYCWNAHVKGEGHKAALFTADKDLRMVPGLHLTWKPLEDGRRALVEVPQHEWSAIGPDGKQYGERWFWEQMLTGDGADNIPGLEFYRTKNSKGFETSRRLGPSAAKKILDKCTNSKEAFSIVAKHYCGWYLQDGWNRFIEQAVLLWMRRGAKAPLLDVMDYLDTLAAIPAALREAAVNLEQRVLDARAKINALTSKGNA